MPIPANVLLEVGDVYTFGRYEQDSKKKDGAEDIEWIALAKSDTGVLLISRYILDCIPYNETRTAVTWQTCTLREWMNGVFYTEAFTHEERQGILQVTLDNEDNPAYHTRGGDSTLDRVFALSASEAEMYLTNANRNTQATVYAAAQGAKLRTENQNKWVYWWLRTPGDKPERAMVTTLRDNSLDYQGNGVGRKFDGGGNNNTGVRPCIWLSWDYLAKDNSELKLTLEGTATGYSGNDITVALTVEKNVIINCTIYDEWATDKMKKGYELTANAIIGKTCEYLQNHSDAEILEEVRAYADGIGQKLTGGKQDEFSAKASIEAVKDALSKINN